MLFLFCPTNRECNENELQWRLIQQRIISDLEYRTSLRLLQSGHAYLCNQSHSLGEY